MGRDDSSYQAAICGLAILKVNWERLGRDYLESFVPLVIECVRQLPADEVSLPVLQRAVQARFGLTLPQNPLKAILQRAAAEGYLRREHGIFLRVSERCGSLDFATAERKVSLLHDQLISALSSYARDVQDLEWSTEQTEEALLGFLSTEDWAVLFATIGGEASLLTMRASQTTRYVVSSFVRDVVLSRPELLDALETLAKGSMLANALFLPSNSTTNKRFKDTRVFLDTSIVIYYLGYGGEDRQAPVLELIQLLQHHGADLRVLPDTLEEVRRILNACAARVRTGRLHDAYGPTIEYFLSKAFTAGDIELMIARFPEKLRAKLVLEEEPPPLTVTFDPTVSADREVPVVDELALEKALLESVGYAKRDALLHDVTSVSAILRLRRGRSVHELETCRAIFLTTNAALARGAKQFCKTDGFAGEVPPCITDYALGNLLWLKSPTAAPDLPRKLLIADAFAATQPSNELWKHYLAEISKLREDGEVTDTDYFVLRHSSSARAAVMHMTKGEKEAFTEGTVEEVLAIAHQTIRGDLNQAIDAKNDQISNLQREHDAIAQASAIVLANEREEAGTLKAALREKEEAEGMRELKMRRRSRSIARIVLFIPKALILGGFVTATTLSFPWSLPSLQAAMPAYLRSGLLATLFLFTLYASFFGTPLQAILARTEEMLAEQIATRLLE